MYRRRRRGATSAHGPRSRRIWEQQLALGEIGSVETARSAVVSHRRYSSHDGPVVSLREMVPLRGFWVISGPVSKLEARLPNLPVCRVPLFLLVFASEMNGLVTRGHSY